jgi:hypothetical protein
VPGSGRDIVAGLLFGGLCMQASAQAIFTCVDAKGRRLTADRPIAECADREQKELSATGTVKRKIGPVLTAEERAVEDEKNRKAIEERNRLAEEKKRERALLTRYPDKAAHEKERAGALAAADDAIVLARKNLEQLVKQHQKLETELEFYRNDPSKAPGLLKRQIEENNEHIEAQKRFIANQDNEKKRINARFDEELVKLKQLWAQRAAPATATAVGAASAPAKR